MAEQELVEYIKKAQAAGQSDGQSRSLLYKNGWTELEINDAFNGVNQPQIKPQQQQPQSQVDRAEEQAYRPQTQQQPQIEKKPESMPQIQRQGQPEYQPQPAENQTKQNPYIQQNNMPRRGGTHLVLKLIVVLIILGLAASGVFALLLSSHIYDPEWNPFAQKPETIILKAWNNLGSVKSENFDIEFLMGSKNFQTSGASGEFDISLKANGSVDNSNANNTLTDIKGSVSASVSDASGPENNYIFSLKGEMHLAQNDIYIKLDDANLTGLEDFLALYKINLEEIKGKWLKIEGNVLLARASSQQPDTVQKHYKNALDRIVKILLDKKAYDITRLPDNQGSEGKEYYYYISLNQKKLTDASPEIIAAINELRAKLYPGQTLSGYTAQNFKKDANSFFAKVGKIGLSVFIGKQDNFFHKIQFVNDFDLNKLNAGYTGNLKVNYKMSQTGINKPVKITVPDNYINFNDVVYSAFEGTVESSKLKSDITSIRYAADSIFSAENSYSSLCNRGLLNGYQKDFGAILISLNNEILNQGAKKPACFSSADNYCISTQLADGSFLCAGKAGNLGKIQCLSALIICQ